MLLPFEGSSFINLSLNIFECCLCCFFYFFTAVCSFVKHCEMQLCSQCVPLFKFKYGQGYVRRTVVVCIAWMLTNERCPELHSQYFKWSGIISRFQGLLLNRFTYNFHFMGWYNYCHYWRFWSNLFLFTVTGWQHALSKRQGNSQNRSPVHHMVNMDRQTVALRGNLDSPIPLTSVCLGYGRKSRQTQGGDHANSTLRLTKLANHWVTHPVPLSHLSSQHCAVGEYCQYVSLLQQTGVISSPLC